MLITIDGDNLLDFTIVLGQGAICSQVHGGKKWPVQEPLSHAKVEAKKNLPPLNTTTMPVLILLSLDLRDVTPMKK